MSAGTRANAARLFLCGLAALYWELALIRWLGASIRIVAYFSNLVLISAFFGLGTGALLTRFPVRLERLLMPLLLLTVMLGVLLGGLWHSNPAGGDEDFWIGAPLGIPSPGGEAGLIVSAGAILIVVYGATAAIFAAFGQYMGRLFKGQPPLRAYTIEVAGSLVGIVLFALLSHAQVSPSLWFIVGTGILLLTLPPRLMDATLAVAMGALMVAVAHAQSRAFVWSPYYRIAVEPIERIVDSRDGARTDFPQPVGYVLTVNNDYHQMMLDLRPGLQDHPFIAGWRAFYDAPYAGDATLPPGRILVVGAGTGNDVAAALRRTGRPVTAVEIDPAIAALGRALHRERPYADPRVTLVLDDARSFFHRARDGEYALVVFGFLDSHRLLSSFSSVRLDNFIYTREAMEEVRRILAPGGRVALSFATKQPWIHERLVALLDTSFDFRTVTARDQQGYVFGTLYVNGRAAADAPAPPRPAIRALVTTDDWPFLYLRQRVIPGHNVLFLVVALALSAGALFLLPRGERRIRLPYVLLGAAFFLLETSNVVRMALLYGSTWWVNTIVFAGILVLVLLGNLTAARWRVPIPACTALLAVLILAAALIPLGRLLDFGAWPRAVVAVTVFLGPVYFGALIFARLIEKESRLFEAYGSNVLGAVLGGSAEYLSLILGFRFLLVVALVLYLSVFALIRRGAPAAGAS